MKKSWLLALLVFFAWAFFITFIHIGIIRSGRQVSKLQQEVSVKEARNQYEELEISRMSGPQEVISFAQEHLHMQEAKPHEVIVLEGRL